MNIELEQQITHARILEIMANEYAFDNHEVGLGEGYYNKYLSLKQEIKSKYNYIIEDIYK